MITFLRTHVIKQNSVYFERKLKRKLLTCQTFVEFLRKFVVFKKFVKLSKNCLIFKCQKIVKFERNFQLSKNCLIWRKIYKLLKIGKFYGNLLIVKFEKKISREFSRKFSYFWEKYQILKKMTKLYNLKKIFDIIFENCKLLEICWTFVKHLKNFQRTWPIYLTFSKTIPNLWKFPKLIFKFVIFLNIWQIFFKFWLKVV